MSKYSGCITLSQICKAEIEEAGEILAKYKVNEDDAEIIKGMIAEAYYHLSDSDAAGRAYDRLFKEITGAKANDAKYFRMWLKLYQKERAKFPFEICDDESDELDGLDEEDVKE